MLNNKEGLFGEIREIVSKTIGVDESEINPDSDLIRDLSADSLELILLIMGLKEKYDIKISDEDAMKIVTVCDAANAVKERIKNRRWSNGK